MRRGKRYYLFGLLVRYPWVCHRHLFHINDLNVRHVLVSVSTQG